jgi:hypothetical protein
MCHFLGGTLGRKCAIDGAFGERVNKILGPGLEMSTDNLGAADDDPASEDRSNFLSQFFLASQAAISANFLEVRHTPFCTAVSMLIPMAY